VVGGGGGMPHRDGTNGSGADSAYLKNTPIEINESEVPVQFLRYGLKPDSGGAGLHRGGLATVMEFKVFAPNSRVTIRNRDRSHFRPWGILGGGPGEPSNLIVNPGTPRELVLGNRDIFTLEPGDIVHIHSPGGGGRGDPAHRDPAAVRLDVERGYVSASRAATDYGVVLCDGEVDEAATRARRLARRANGSAHFCFGPERDRFEAVWSPQAYAAMTAILAGMPIHWRFFVKTKLFASMKEMVERGETPDVGRAMTRVRGVFPQIP
jgi:N-methylhydantoinase B